MNSIKKQWNTQAIVLEWWPVVVGLLVLYIPTFYDLWNGLWKSEAHGHGPVILAMVLYLFWQKRQVFQHVPALSRPIMGSIVLGIGLLFYALGRSQEVVVFETGSLILVLTGTLLITLGEKGLRECWFPIAFIIFMIPLPGALIDGMTNPLRQYISVLAENLLYHTGYPIARNGVTLMIGPYQLLVAEACSGLHSMFSLSAVAVFYLYQMHHRSLFRNILILISILPIAFMANLLRVIALILITYYFGDEVGQGFIHGFTGMFLFITALLGVVFLDSLLGWIAKQRKQEKVAQ